MNFGDGDVLSVLSSDTIAVEGIRGLSDVFATFGKFDKPALISAISINYGNILRNLSLVVNTITSDLDDENIKILERISNPKDSYLSKNCNHKFIKDSWIPSISKKQTNISCDVQSGGKGNIVTCTSMTNINCRGCMDST